MLSYQLIDKWPGNILSVFHKLARVIFLCIKSFFPVLSLQPKLTSRDLLDLVASHFKLKEKEYFGLCYQDDS